MVAGVECDGVRVQIRLIWVCWNRIGKDESHGCDRSNHQVEHDELWERWWNFAPTDGLIGNIIES